MQAIAVLLIALGGILQVGGILWAILGFDGLNVPLLVGALLIGGSTEGAGIFLLIRDRAGDDVER